MKKKEDKNKTPEKNKPLKNWAFFTGLGLQIGVTVYLMAFFGEKLDLKFETSKPYFAFGLVIFGLVASIYSVVKQLNKMNDE